jgi:hypothetical protein
MVMYGGTISWASNKQPSAAASIIGAEYKACRAAAQACTEQGTRGDGLAFIRLSTRWACGDRV